MDDKKCMILGTLLCLKFTAAAAPWLSPSTSETWFPQLTQLEATPLRWCYPSNFPSDGCWHASLTTSAETKGVAEWLHTPPIRMCLWHIWSTASPHWSDAVKTGGLVLPRMSAIRTSPNVQLRAIRCDVAASWALHTNNSNSLHCLDTRLRIPRGSTQCHH
jgi:hypothetical protein